MRDECNFAVAVKRVPFVCEGFRFVVVYFDLRFAWLNNVHTRERAKVFWALVASVFAWFVRSLEVGPGQSLLWPIFRP